MRVASLPPVSPSSAPAPPSPRPPWPISRCWRGPRHAPCCPCSRKQATGLLLLLLVVLLIVDACSTHLIKQSVDAFLQWYAMAPMLQGLLLFVLCIVLGTLLFLPGVIWTLAAGLVFRMSYNTLPAVLLGSAVVMLGATVGALLAFLLGRYVLRDMMRRKVERSALLRALDHALSTQGVKIVVLLRLSPLVPFNAFNFLMGACSVTLRDYTIGSVGMLPGTVAYVYLGTLVSDVRNLREHDAKKANPALTYSLLALGIVAALLAVGVISYYAKLSLQKIEQAEREAGWVEPEEDGGEEGAELSQLAGEEATQQDMIGIPCAPAGGLVTLRPPLLQSAGPAQGAPSGPAAPTTDIQDHEFEVQVAAI
eukprot:g38172.t1